LSVGIADEADSTPIDTDAAVEPKADRPWWRGPQLSIDRRSLIAFCAAIVVATLPFFDVLVGRRTAMYGDVNDLSVPEYVTVWRQIFAGHLPWWTPDLFAGHSMLGAGQFAIFYPLNILFGLLSPVTAYRWWFLLHIWIATAGAFAWSLRRFRSRPGAIVSGVAYACSGTVVLHLVHPPFIIGMAWLPVLFFAIDRVRERWTTGRAALVAVSVAMIAFAGHPQILYIALLGLAVYVGMLWYLSDESHMVPLRAALAVAIGLGLAAVQLIPTFKFSRTSLRSNLTQQAAFEASMLPHNLLTFIFPWIYGGSHDGTVFTQSWSGGLTQHEVASAAGATIIVLSLLACWWLRKETVIRALLAVIIVSLIFALGGSTPIGHVIYRFVPGGKTFRIWARTALLANLALAMLAGAGVREVLKRPRRALIPLFSATLLLLFVAILLPHFHRIREFMAKGPYEIVARGFPIFCLFVLVAGVAIMPAYRRVGAVLVVGICLFEVTSFAYLAEWRESSAPAAALRDFYSTAPPSFGRPYDAPGGVDRWVSDSYGFRSVSLVKKLRGVNGYDPLMQREWADTAAGFAYDGYPQRKDFWTGTWLPDVLRVSTMVLNKSITPSDPSWKYGGDVGGIDFARWIRAPRLPEAYLVGDVRVASLGSIRNALQDPNSPFLTSALVEHDSTNIDQLHDPQSPGVVQSADVLGSGNVEVDPQHNALLVLSHDWEDGWHATVDGHSTPVLRTNGLVLGIYVPAGRHTVHLHYSPPGLHEGAWLAFISLLALFAIGPVARRARAASARRKTSTPPSGAGERDRSPMEV
jgi:hypothetical protein